MKEYLATLDDTAWGAASEVVPKFVSPSDPAAQWTGAHKGPAVEASRAIRQAEAGAAKTMIERTEERFGHKAGAACWRYRLRGSSDAELAGRGKGYRATYSRVRQIEARRRHLLDRGITGQRHTLISLGPCIMARDTIVGDRPPIGDDKGPVRSGPMFFGAGLTGAFYGVETSPGSLTRLFSAPFMPLWAFALPSHWHSRSTSLATGSVWARVTARRGYLS